MDLGFEIGQECKKRRFLAERRAFWLKSAEIEGVLFPGELVGLFAKYSFDKAYMVVENGVISQIPIEGQCAFEQSPFLH